LFNRVLSSYQTTTGTLTRKFDFVSFGCTAGRQKSLEQCDTRLKYLLTRITDATANVVELLRLTCDRDHIACLNGQVESRRVGKVMCRSRHGAPHDHYAAGVVSHL